MLIAGPPGVTLDNPVLTHRIRGTALILQPYLIAGADRKPGPSLPDPARTPFFFFSPDDALIGAVLGPELKPPGSALSDICLVTFLVARAATTARLFPWIRILVCSVLQRSPSAAHHHRCSPTHLTQGTSPLLSVWHCVVVGYLDSCCRQS